MSRFLADRRLLIVSVVSVAATIAGCAMFIMIAASQGLDSLRLTGDSKGYILLAENLLEHGVFSVSQGEPFELESFRAPGYPVFLAALFTLFGVSFLALLVHALIASAAPIFLYILARPIYEKAAFWGSIIFVFEPVRLFLSASFLSDAFFTVLFLAMLALTFAVKEGSILRALSVGILLGVCILVRPIAIFLPLLFAAYFVVDHHFSKRGFLVGFCVGLGALIVISPWMYRNHVVFGSWNIASVGVANLMLYNAPEFLKWKPTPEGNATLAVFQAEQESLPRHEALSLARSDVFEEAFLEIIRGREVEYIIFHVMKTVPFFISDGLRDTIRLFNVDIGVMPNISTALLKGDITTLVSYLRTGGTAITLFVVGVGFWCVVFLLFVFESVCALLRREWLGSLFLTLLVAYFAFLTGPVSNARYRVPVEGLMLVIAARALYRLQGFRKETVPSVVLAPNT